MSQENVETLRQAMDAVNRRDRSSWLTACDPEIENVPPRDWPESERTRGPDAVWDFFVESMEAWESAAFEYSEIIEAGANMLVAEVTGELKGKASGAPVPWSFWQVVEIRSGRAIRIDWFVDRGDALRAVGLAE
jgi:ketosteroid isomerase-like protein